MRVGSSTSRTWWLLIGGVAFLVFGLTALEKLVGTPRVSSENETSDRMPAGPRVRRLDDGAIEIREDLFRRTTIRVGDDAEQQALLECLSSGFDRAFGDGRIRGLSRREVRAETRRIRDECMGSRLPHVPPLPPPPPPAGQ